MRLPVVAALLLTTTLSTPALAARRHAEDAEAARVASKLNDPAMQSAVSGMMVAMADMMMDVRIDRFREALAKMDPDARQDHGMDDARTLGDIVERDNPHFREDLADNSRMAVGTVGTMASGLADMLPEFRAMADRMSRDLEKTMRRLPRD